MCGKNNPGGWFCQERMENSAVFTFSTDVTFQFWAELTDEMCFLFWARQPQRVFAAGETLPDGWRPCPAFGSRAGRTCWSP